MTTVYARLVKRTPISFADEGHVREFAAPKDYISREQGVVRVTRGEEWVDFPFDDVVAAYAGRDYPNSLEADHARLRAFVRGEKPTFHDDAMGRMSTPDQKFAHLAPEPEKVHPLKEEAHDAAEKGKQQEDSRGKHPQGNRRR